MQSLEHRHYHRIAFNLVTAKHQKARRRLLKKHIGPTTLPNLSPSELDLLGFPAETIEEIRNNYLGLAEEEVSLAEQEGVEVIFNEDELFPPLLTEIFDPPDFIYACGDVETLKTPKMAVVGSRKASNYGWMCLDRILPDVCAADFTIVSGMAYGIDSMAHQIAVREKRPTIGVNAGGLRHLYPAGNKELIREIMNYGCVISEFAMDVKPRPFYFPIRNRIIAGVSKAILIVEAALKSGSLITARLGLEQNREIFAVPGRIDSPISQGTNFLIQQGAKPVTCAKDILDEFGITLQKEEPEELPDLSPKEKKIVDMMSDGELKSVDFLIDRLEESASATISLLMGLLLKNIVREEAGGYRLIT